MFLGPLNVLSTIFQAHMSTFDSGQISWPVGPRGNLVRKKIYFFLLFFPKEISFCFFELYICCLNVFKQKRRYLIQVKILVQSDPGAFSYKIDTRFFFFFFLIFLNNFPFVSWSLLYAIYMFSCKNADLGFRSKL